MIKSNAFFASTLEKQTKMFCNQIDLILFKAFYKSPQKVIQFFYFGGKKVKY